MRSFKHYSFDLWLTLIKSDPLFKIRRTNFFHQQFNPAKKSVEDVAAIFRQVDIMCNNINEKTGKNIDADEMYLMVISMISDFAINLNAIDTDLLYQQMEELLFDNIPLLYSHETRDVLVYLKEKQACTISILSNTGFIKGSTLRKVLKRIGIYNFFDFQLYSDEVGFSKPSQKFFSLMFDEVRMLHENCTASDILHVGDNCTADIEGATLAGMNCLLINSNDNSIDTLLCSKFQPTHYTK